jgi:hypothetical protein
MVIVLSVAIASAPASIWSARPPPLLLTHPARAFAPRLQRLMSERLTAAARMGLRDAGQAAGSIA